MIRTGSSASMTFTVTEDDTARAVGSGSLAVLATPRLIAWLEATTCAAIAEQLSDGQTSVGSRIDVHHQAPSAVGAQVAVTASVVHVDGRLVRFTCAARNLESPGVPGKTVGAGEITRVVVDADKFMSRL